MCLFFCPGIMRRLVVNEHDFSHDTVQLLNAVGRGHNYTHPTLTFGKGDARGSLLEASQ